MQIRVIRLGRGSGPLLGVLAVGAGLLAVVFGLVLLAVLAGVAAVATTGALLLRGLRGPRRSPAEQLEPPDGWRAPLDPRLEVRIVDGATTPRGGGQIAGGTSGES